MNKNTGIGYVHPLYYADWFPKTTGSTRGNVKKLQRVSSQLKAQKSMTRELLLFRQLIHSSPNPILITNKQAKIIYVNPAWEMLTGYLFEEIEGKNPKVLKSGKTSSKVYAKMFDALKNDRAFVSNDMIDKRKDGTEYSIHTAIFPIHLAFKKTYFVQVSHDITHQKLNEEAREELNKRIVHILDSISDGFISLDTKWRFTYINKQAEKLLSGKRDGVLGKVIWKAYPHLIKTEFYKKCHQAVKQAEVLKFKIKIGPGNWYDMHLYPQIDGLSIYLNDITLEKEIEQRKDDFISIASHELKTPVASLYLYSELLKKALAHQNFTKAIDFSVKIDAKLSSLKELIDKLLNSNSIQSGKLILRKQPFKLNDLLEEIVSKSEDVYPTHKVVLKAMVKTKIVADRSRIGEVLENLVTNAMKYSPDAKKICVSARKEKGFVIVSIQDFGIGIPKEKQDKIFHRFYRVNGKNGSSYSGLGLGLYIASEIIKEHGGKIWIESKERKGSIFSFSLPIK